MSTVRAWLPTPEVEAALSEEPRRFRAIFQAVRSSWEKNKGLDPCTRSLKSLEWLSLVKGLETERHKAAVSSDDVNSAVALMLDIVLSSGESLATRTNWAQMLSCFLHDFRWKILVSVPWRPFYDTLSELYGMPRKTGYSGPLAQAQEVEQLISLARRARRFFPAGSAAEIWDHIRPMLADTNQPDAYLGLGWMALLLPTRQVSQQGGDWNLWVTEWMTAWESVVHSNSWDALWLTLFSRLAKHDNAGVIDWAPHIPRIFTKCLWAFQVPVGTASAAPPFGEDSVSENSLHVACIALFQTHGCDLFDEELEGRRPPDGVSALFHQILTKRSPKAAKLLIWLLGRAHQPAGPDSIDENDVALLGLERLSSLLEQYYHPSNNGKWTGTLALFLEHLTRHFSKRVVREQSPGGAMEMFSSDDETLHTLQNGHTPGGKAVVAPRAALSEDAQQRVAKLIVKLASKAQYAKDRDMVSKACFALVKMAPWVPHIVLPLVQCRFQMALDAVTAAHQLAIAVHTLGLAVRPLLIAGLSTPEDQSEDALPLPPRIAAAEAIAAAMNATLPGIDANDDRKTRAVFRFYCIVLSSVGELPLQQSQESALPLYTEEWLEEVLARIFAILTNLDSPETRSDLSPSGPAKANHDCQSFLLNNDCMFRPMIELLLARIPLQLRVHAIKRIARFVMGTTLPSVAAETGILCSVPSWIAPAETAQYLAAPLLERIEAELPSLQRAAPSGMHISKVQQTSLTWQLTLLSSSLFNLGVHALPLKAHLIHVLDALLALPSQRLAEPTAAVMGSLLHGLLSYYPLNEAAAATALPGTEVDGVPVEEWLSIDGTVPSRVAEGMKPSYHIPSREEVAFADLLIQKHFVGAANELKAICRGNSNGQSPGVEKDVVRGILHRIQHTLNGARTSLADFQHEGPDLPGEDLSVHAAGGARIGTPQMRHTVAEALLVACKHDFSDPEIQQHLMEVVDEILSSGYEEHAEQSNNSSAWKSDDALLHEDRTVTRLTKLPGKWRVRRPRWMQVSRVQLLLQSRAAASAYRPQTTSQFPTPPLSWVPTVFKELCAEMLRYSLQSYKVVSTAADAGLRRAVKRYPCLISPILPTLMSALGGLPLPSQKDVMESFWAEPAPHASPSEPQIDMALLKQLVERAESAATQSTSTSTATAAVEEGRVGGALGLLSSPAIWRACTRHLGGSMGSMAALLAASSHRSPNTLASVANTFALFLLRFLRPAGLDSPQVAEKSESLQLIIQLLLRLGEASLGAQVHWHLSLMANGLLLMLTPPHTSSQAAQLASHYFPLLMHQLIFQRTIAAIHLTVMLAGKQPWNTKELREASQEAVREALARDPEWGAKFMELFSHVHPVAPSTQENGSQEFGGRSRDDMLVKILSTGMLKDMDWPVGRPVPTAVRDSSFHLGHTRLILALTMAAPEQMMSTMRAPLTKALTGVPQREDRPMTLMAIEIIAALVSSGAVFNTPGSGRSAWNEWVKPLLMGAMSAAPLDYGEAWAVALRYSLHMLSEHSEEGFEALLAITGLPIAEDAGSVALTKSLKIIGHALAELNSLGVLGCKPHPAGDRVKKAGQAYQRQALAALPTLTHSMGETVRKHVASCTVVLMSSLLFEGSFEAAESTPMETDTASAHANQLKQAVGAYIDILVQAMEDGAAVILAAEGQTGALSNGEAGTEHGSTLLQNPAIARLGTALQVINQALRGGEGLCAVAMRPALLRMLPPLLRIQEMAAPELQPLALEAKSGAVVLKHLPTPAHQVPGIIASIEAVSLSDQWPARAASLVFVQYFWFRHIFLVSAEQSSRCQQLVMRLMCDKKLEVQEMAASTLSGMLKGLSEADFHLLRADLVARAQCLFPRGRKRAAGNSGESTMVEKHAVVLGLKALVLCTPYDVPTWLPESLMALVQASTQPAPIKSTVRKALSEFKRTHEEAGLAEARRMLTEEQWDAIQGIASPASYFA